MSNYKDPILEDFGKVTYWSELQQKWIGKVKSVPLKEFALMSYHNRLRVAKHSQNKKMLIKI